MTEKRPPTSRLVTIYDRFKKLKDPTQEQVNGVTTQLRELVVSNQTPNSQSLLDLISTGMNAVMEQQKGKPLQNPKDLKGAGGFLNLYAQVISEIYRGKEIPVVQDNKKQVEKQWNVNFARNSEYMEDFAKLVFSTLSPADPQRIIIPEITATVMGKDPEWVAHFQKDLSTIENFHPNNRDPLPLNEDKIIGLSFKESPDYAFRTVAKAICDTVDRFNKINKSFVNTITDLPDEDRAEYEALFATLMLVMQTGVDTRLIRGAKRKEYLDRLLTWKDLLVQQLMQGEASSEVQKVFAKLSMIRLPQEGEAYIDMRPSMVYPMISTVAHYRPDEFMQLAGTLQRKSATDVRDLQQKTISEGEVQRTHVTDRFLRSQMPSEAFAFAQIRSITTEQFYANVSRLIPVEAWRDSNYSEVIEFISNHLEEHLAFLGFSRTQALTLEKRLRESSPDYPEELGIISVAVDDIRKEIQDEGLKTKPTGTLKHPRTYIYYFENADHGAKVFGQGASLELYGANEDAANPVLHFTLNFPRNKENGEVTENPICGSLDMTTLTTTVWGTTQTEDYPLLREYLDLYVLSLFSDLSEREEKNLSDAEKGELLIEAEEDTNKATNDRRDFTNSRILQIPSQLTIRYRGGKLDIQKTLPGGEYREVSVRPTITFTARGRQYAEAVINYERLKRECAAEEEINKALAQVLALYESVSEANMERLRSEGYSEQDMAHLATARHPITGERKVIQTNRKGFDQTRKVTSATDTHTRRIRPDRMTSAYKQAESLTQLYR